MKKILFLLFCILSLVGCNSADPPAADPFPLASGGEPVDAPVITSSYPAKQSGYESEPRFKITNVETWVGSSLKIYGDNHCGTLVGSVDTGGAYAGILLTLTLTQTGLIEFSIKAFDGLWNGQSACVGYSYTLFAPPVPSSISLSLPSSSPSTDPTPRVMVSGVSKDVTVTLFTDSSCTNAIGSTGSTGSSVSITASSLAVGIHNFYAQTKNESNMKSACSASLLQYEVQALPPATSVAKLIPAAASGLSNWVRLSVTGISGTSIKVYSDSSCTLQTAAPYTGGGATGEFYLENLSVGIHDFYVKRFASDGSSSACSASFATYEVLANTKYSLNSETTYSGVYTGRMVFGDVDNDAIEDLFTTGSFHGATAIGVGNGVYQNGIVLTSLFPTSGGGPIALGDLNGDNLDDLIVGFDYPEYGVGIYLSNGDGTYGNLSKTVTPDGVNDVKVFDVNTDGNLDVIAAAGTSFKVFLGGGDGTLAAPTIYELGGSVEDIVLSDLDLDGDMDVVSVLYFTSTISVSLNNGSGTFSASVDYGGTTGMKSLDFVDINKDGHLDAMLTHSSGFGILTGVGDGTFNTMSSFSGLHFSTNAFAICDLDSDGNLDMIAASSSSSEYHVLLGNGDGSFNYDITHVAPARVGTIVCKDLNSDSKNDLLFGYSSGSGGIGVSLQQ